MRIGFSPRSASRMLAAAVAVMTLAAPVGAARAAVTDAFYDRVFMLAAHQKCDLFEPRLIAALDAAALQARGAALRVTRSWFTRKPSTSTTSKVKPAISILSALRGTRRRWCMTKPPAVS